MSQPKLKALLIGINDYGGNESDLSGCINDVYLMKSLLEEKVDSQRLCIKVLEDKHATYKNVTETFLKFFDDLEDGDQALFFFSGHGSRMKAPLMFQQDTNQDHYETFVLYDSRRGGGRDLADKELAYLCWEVTHEKDVFLTVITDSCFSGGMMRGEEAKVRHEPDLNQNRPWNDFLGYEKFKIVDGKAVLPTSPRVVISACQKDEVAVEHFVNDKDYGLFTYNLVEVLRASNGQLTFEMLIRKVQARLQGSFTTEQRPRLHQNSWQYRHRIIFNNIVNKRPDRYILSYNYNSTPLISKGWVIDVGSIHGIDPSFADKNTRLTIVSKDSTNSQEIQLIEVLQKHSKVEVPVGLDKDLEYEVIFISYPAEPMSVAFHPYNKEALGESVLLKSWENQSSVYLQLLGKKEWHKTKYLVHAEEDHYWIRPIGERMNPLFDKLYGFTIGTADQVFFNLNKMAKWHRVKEYSNPLSNLKIDQLLDLVFYKVTRISDQKASINELIPVPDFLDKPPILDYQPPPPFGPGQINASFKLNIKNTSEQTLYLSTLYLGSDYSISNDYMNMETLLPGKDTWLYYVDDYGYETKSIDLFIEPAYLKKGISKIWEAFKIIVSTQHFSTSHFNQDGIPPNSRSSEEVMRGDEDEKKLETKADWDAIDFSVILKHYRN